MFPIPTSRKRNKAEAANRLIVRPIRGFRNLLKINQTLQHFSGFNHGESVVDLFDGIAIGHVFGGVPVQPIFMRINRDLKSWCLRSKEVKIRTA